MPKLRLKKKKEQRLSADERRRRIIEAVVALFASDGFRGVTTKVLAKTAQVSEALLYRYFPSKEALYAEVQDQYCRAPDDAMAAVKDLPPSTSTLISVLFFLTSVIADRGHGGDRESLAARLVINSILEDGAFARLLVQRNSGPIMQLMQQSLTAAISAGDAKAPGALPELNLWFCHHMLMHLHIYLRPQPPIIVYPEEPGVLVDQAMRFMLRGLGLTPAAVNKHYDYQRLANWAAKALASDKQGSKP